MLRQNYLYNYVFPKGTVAPPVQKPKIDSVKIDTAKKVLPAKVPFAFEWKKGKPIEYFSLSI